MPVKKCLICEEEAKFAIKSTNDYYCEECAQDQFGDISYLVKIEEATQQQEKSVINKLEEEQEILKEE
ncbi:hypothetical protein HZC31_06690 [Candidatus Woesearchaeota archaeon]|nr:hypothetical protein [Candidatus Woesearchaeota archaeon]